MTFPLEIPCEQHRFILGKRGVGLKEIFDKTNVYVRIPNQEENLPTIQVIGETEKIGEAITIIYKMVTIDALHSRRSTSFSLFAGQCSNGRPNQCTALDARRCQGRTWCSYGGISQGSSRCARELA